MRLTHEQRQAINEPGHVCLVSCPGSGKTRVIIAKLLYCIETVRDSTRRVACITHTNAAADEIDARLRETCFGNEDVYYEVSTIHGFALQTILRPFGHLLPEFPNGFQILTSDDEAYQTKANELLARHRLRRGVLENFDRIQRLPGGAFAQIEGLPIELQEQWCSWLDESACTTLGDIVYHSGRLVASHPYIASALASHFAWILIDEFQDSTPGQIAILQAIHAFNRTQFFCVGDPNQSIYRFAGASPDLLTGFATQIRASTRLQLTGNFRSSTLICERAELLRAATPPMRAVGVYADWPVAPVHHTVPTTARGILEIFLPAARALNVPLGEIAILAPWWVSLFHLARELRAVGIPAIGPGARPYKRAHLVSQIVEPIGAYLESPEGDIAIAIQRALFIVIASLTDRSPYVAFDFRGRLIICQLLAEAQAARRESERAVDWIVEATTRFSRILVSAEILPPAAGAALNDSAAEMAADILDRPGGGALTIEDLGVFARPKHCVQLLTVHKAKGREFEAVAVIDAIDGRFPHFSIRDITDPAEFDAQFDETRRVVYVAVTRAKRLLMFFSDTSDPRNRSSPYLAEMGL
jgi:DNA helicase-2/ATP-dependent DNA helicase PcrA